MREINENKRVECRERKNEVLQKAAAVLRCPGPVIVVTVIAGLMGVSVMTEAKASGSYGLGKVAEAAGIEVAAAGPDRIYVEKQDRLVFDNRVAGSWWEADIWKDPARPFLFYGEDRKPAERGSEGRRETESDGRLMSSSGAGRRPAESLAGEGKESEVSEIFPADGLDKPGVGEALTVEAETAGLAKLASFKTVSELKEEVNKRLERAVMNPTPAAIALYLQANAFLMQKAGTFAETWRRTLTGFPQYDWTAVRPAVNVASTAFTREREGRILRTVAKLSQDWGFVFFGNAGDLTRKMLPIAESFAAENGFELVKVSVTEGVNPLMPEARSGKDLAARTGRGITMFPALVLLNKHDAGLAKARLIATGVVDATELARRTVAAAEKESGRLGEDAVTTAEAGVVEDGGAFMDAGAFVNAGQ